MRRVAQTLKINVNVTEIRDFLDEGIDFERRLRTPTPTLVTVASGQPLTDPWAEWEALKSHNTYCALFVDNPSFAEALQTFRKRRNLDANGTDIEQLRLLQCILEARFILVVTIYVLRYMQETKTPELIKEADARTRAQAVTSARKILLLTKKGARLENIQQQDAFHTLLKQYIYENEKIRQKRPRNDDSRAQRLFVSRLARHFIEIFDEAYTSIIVTLAAAVGYTVDERNIEKIVSAERRALRPRNTNALARLGPFPRQ